MADDITKCFMGELIAQIWNRSHAESTGMHMIPSTAGGFIVVDTTGNEWLRTVNTYKASA
ncbi:hypothetical protein [Dietzia sp. UCD-THP]|uniref:hypothetical protein n=1 Tax=Dietzia sp. UCD-THP TaxID=1292020 RepID=UPI00126918A7|nr:hypothetical protein [Dietzia sp. UCD-THP]